MPKHVQIQFIGKGDEWYAAGDVLLLPDGRVEWTDNKFVTDSFVRESMYHPDEGRELRIAEPEKFFDAWLHFNGNRNFRIVDMDDPEMAACVLPQADWPRVSAKPESIQPFQEEGGVET